MELTENQKQITREVLKLHEDGKISDKEFEFFERLLRSGHYEVSDNESKVRLHGKSYSVSEQLHMALVPDIGRDMSAVTITDNGFVIENKALPMNVDFKEVINECKTV